MSQLHNVFYKWTQIIYQIWLFYSTLIYISKSATFTLTFKLFLTGEAFHYTSTNHDNHHVSGCNDSSICHRRAKMNHNKKNHQNQISSFQDIAFQNFGRH